MIKAKDNTLSIEQRRPRYPGSRHNTRDELEVTWDPEKETYEIWVGQDQDDREDSQSAVIALDWDQSQALRNWIGNEDAVIDTTKEAKDGTA